MQKILGALRLGKGGTTVDPLPLPDLCKHPLGTDARMNRDGIREVKLKAKVLIANRFVANEIG